MARIQFLAVYLYMNISATRNTESTGTSTNTVPSTILCCEGGNLRIYRNVRNPADIRSQPSLRIRNVFVGVSYIKVLLTFCSATRFLRNRDKKNEKNGANI